MFKTTEWHKNHNFNIHIVGEMFFLYSTEDIRSKNRQWIKNKNRQLIKKYIWPVNYLKTFNFFSKKKKRN